MSHNKAGKKSRMHCPLLGGMTRTFLQPFGLSLGYAIIKVLNALTNALVRSSIAKDLKRLRTSPLQCVACRNSQTMPSLTIAMDPAFVNSCCQLCEAEPWPASRTVNSRLLNRNMPIPDSPIPCNCVAVKSGELNGAIPKAGLSNPYFCNLIWCCHCSTLSLPSVIPPWPTRPRHRPSVAWHPSPRRPPVHHSPPRRAGRPAPAAPSP